MPLLLDLDQDLSEFLARSDFARSGAIVTDLDGTAVHEFESRIFIPDPVSHGLKHLNDLGRPVVLNTLRFPLNVIQTFGREWYAITNAPLPLVSLNGSLVGYLQEDVGGQIVFEEIEAFPLRDQDVEGALGYVKALLDDGIDDLLVFFYARDWSQGETIWTPQPEKVPHLREKYLSASSIIATGFEGLCDALREREICMVFLLVEISQDRLMAYQHIKPSSFVTRPRVDKLFGAQVAAERLGFDLAASVGCGDTPMDSFLAGVGLAVQVGPLEPAYSGLFRTLRIGNSLELGDLLFRLGQLHSEVSR